MKKSLKNLQLRKEVISNLNAREIKGGDDQTLYPSCFYCPTDGPRTTCPPPGEYCYIEP